MKDETKRKIERLSLERLFRRNAIDIGHCAHIAVDVQPAYCGGAADVTLHITRNVAPFFNRSAIPTYWMHMGEPETLHESIVVAPRDRIMRKATMSSFRNTGLGDDLKRRDKKLVFVDGFCRGACVDATARDGIKHGYHVVILSDCITRPTEAWIAKMRAENIHVVESVVARNFLHDLKKQNNLYNPVILKP